MELYAAVRRSVYVEGVSERAAARRFGLARETVRKMLRYRRPPGYRREKPVRCPKLDAFTGIFGSERLTGALLDRLTHHVHILELNGDSYRLEHSKKARQPAATPAS